MLADEIHAYLAAALERNIGKFESESLLKLNGDDLIFLGRACPAHLHAVVSPRAFFNRSDVLFGGLERRFRVHPENELVKRDPGDRGQVLPAERHARGERCREKVGEGDDDNMRVTLFTFYLEKTFCARSARLVYRYQGTRREFVLLSNSGDEPGHLVGPASCARRNNKLDGFRWFPSLCRIQG